MKNKRRFAFCTKRTVFVALFLVGVLISSAVTTFILNANAQLMPVRSVEIFSEHSSFENNAPGAWKITKTAKWTDVGKARVTFEVESRAKINDTKKLDVLMVIDNSGSMSGEKLDQVKHDATDLANALLSTGDNKMALVTFNTDADILSDFTNDKTEFINLVNGIDDAGCTNYYRGFLKAEEILNGYVHEDDRELILLFLTDGFPNEETPNEVAEYRTIKTKYPYIVINGVQYEMGDKVLQPIIDVSDNQYIADMSSLHNVLFEATTITYAYDEFVLTDYVNDDYWTVAGLEAISAMDDLGDINLDDSAATPKITWDLSGQYRSGQIARLTIDVELKSEFTEQPDLLLPTNKHEEIRTSIDEVQDETIDSHNTPILKSSYNVIYDENLPSGCEMTGSVPDTESHIVLSAVKISDNVLSCQNYAFKGWRLEQPEIAINDEYFRMPENDVYVHAIWAKPSISKSMDGTMHTRGTATFAPGWSVNSKMKALAQNAGGVITAIKKADSLSTLIDTTNSANKLSDSNSPLPIYGWFNNGTIYYYTDADDIYLNSESWDMFYTLDSLTDIDGMRYVSAKNVTNMSSMFWGTALSNLEPIKDWDVSKVTNMRHMFRQTTALRNIDDLAKWDTSSVTDMTCMFEETAALENIDGALNWNVSNVTSMAYMFNTATALTNINGALNWNVKKVRTFDSMFYKASSLTNIDGAINWHTDSLNEVVSMFYQATALTNINGALNWNMTNISSTKDMFNGASSLMNINGAINWKFDNLTDMTNMFHRATALADISGAEEWDVSKVTTMSNTFYSVQGVTTLAALHKWKTTSLTDLNYTFANMDGLLYLTGLEDWDVTKVTNMSSTFSSNDNVLSLDPLEKWKPISAETMNSMFSWNQSITNVNGLKKWVVSNVTNMSWMFYKNVSLTDLSGFEDWDTSSVTNMSYMFSNDTGITSIDDLAGWDVSAVTTMADMFSSASNLSDISTFSEWTTTSLESMSNFLRSNNVLTSLSGFEDWDTTSLRNISGAFAYLENLTNISALSSWNVDDITNMAELFYLDRNLTNISPISGWNTANVTNMSGMFNTCDKLTNLTPISGWNVTSVTNMSKMFHMTWRGRISDISALSGWRTPSLTNMSSMFYRVGAITNLDALREWTVDGVTNMSYIFEDLSSLTDISGISGWNVSNVTNFNSAFDGDTGLTSLAAINDWAVSGTASMNNMFRNVPGATNPPGWYH